MCFIQSALKFHQHDFFLNPRTTNSSSESCTSMSGSTTDSGDEADGGIGSVDLSHQRLQSLHAHGSVPKKDLDAYAKRGMSAKRIKTSVHQPRCHCLCKIPVKILYQICLAFWTLTKNSQDSCLWSIQNESHEKKKRWYMAGPKHSKSKISGLMFKHDRTCSNCTGFQTLVSLQDTLCVVTHGPTCSGLESIVYLVANVSFRAKMAGP